MIGAERRTLDAVVRRAGDLPVPAVVVVNPDDEVSPEAFLAWLDQLQKGEPLHLGVTAAQTLAEARAAGEV
jgi:cell division protein FtsX